MNKDFYLDERTLASYLEKDWFDHIQNYDSRKPAFEFAPFEASALYSDHHERIVRFLADKLARAAARPRSMMEVGSSLGRTFYEICLKIKSIDSAILIEPSLNLFNAFGKIFEGQDIAEFEILKGNLAFDHVRLDTVPIRSACSAVNLSKLNQRFQDVSLRETFDLVICSNVIDQCTDPHQLVDFLKEKTSPGGFILLSCTYQWNDKYIGNAPELIKDINVLFDALWNFQGEINVPFHVRIYERYWMTFLSHVIIYRAPGTKLNGNRKM